MPNDEESKITVRPMCERDMMRFLKHMEDSPDADGE